MLALLLGCSGTPSTEAEPPAPPPVEAPAAPAPTRVAANVMDRFEPLQGRWRAAEDSRAEVLIVKSIWLEGYDGQEQRSAVMEWADGCRTDGGKPDPAGEYLNLLDDTPRCLQLRSVSQEALELVELPDETVLRYVRAPADGM